jgi:hypothetical protein
MAIMNNVILQLMMNTIMITAVTKILLLRKTAIYVDKPT